MKHTRGFLKLVSSARRKVREIAVAAVRSRLQKRDGMVLIDVREDHEWDKAHIDGAIHVSRGILERDIERIVPDKNTEIVLYCGGGYRSLLSGESLKKMGYRKVFSMKDGWRGGRSARGPIEKGPR